jgi:glycosyltransferase involved in cell wall biosynthesis
MTTPIIAFSKDWHEDHTSNHHVLRELAKTRRVLWLNSVGTRKPSMSSSRDLGKIKRKLTEFAKGAVNVENDLWIATPLVLPLPHSPIALKINQQIIRATIRALRYQLGIKDFQLWTFLPNTVNYVGTLGEKMAVYYCVDEWSTFTALDAAATIASEKRLLEKVDITFGTSQALVDSKSQHSRITKFAPHGVNYASFARALEDDLQIPADLAKIPHPRLGFFGTLRDLIDYNLITGFAKARPDVHIALIGQKHVNLEVLEAMPNVHFLGQKKHDELAAYCKGFDVGWIPYRIDDNVKFINPLKLREYLSAGVPVISTSMPEVMPYKHLAHIADTPEETSVAFDKALGESSPEARQERSASMKTETWPARVADIAQTVDAIERAKDADARLAKPVGVDPAVPVGAPVTTRASASS